MEEMSYVFSFTFFSLPLIFFLHWWPLALIFSFCHRCYKIFMLFFQQKNFSFVFYLSLQISVALFLVEFRWPAAFSLFFCLSLALYSKFVDMTINLSLILQKTRIQKQFPLSSLLNFQLPLLYKTRVAMRFPAKITSICIWVAIPVD